MTHRQPNPGLTVPVDLHRIRDGDTVEVRLPGSAIVWALRLIHCWTPETRGPQREFGLRAKKHCEGLLARADQLVAHVPLPASANVLASLTFDRVPAYLWLDSRRTLNQQMVDDGYAWPDRRDTLPPIFTP